MDNTNSGKIVFGYALHQKRGAFEPYLFTRRATLPDDVVFRILYCHDDLHCIREDYKDPALQTTYPLVPGHEIVGVVCEVGENVERFKIGDTVGVGSIVDSCRHCENCMKGQEQYCSEKYIRTYNDKNVYANNEHTHGGYSTLMVVSERFALKIPQSLPLDGAAPLLCAGISVYSPMKHYKMEAGQESKSFGVIGLGGLGYLAAKFARAMGMTVTIISRTPEKEPDAKEHLRMDSFVVSTDPKQMQRASKSLDFIIDTIPVEHSIDPYLALLKTNGQLIVLGNSPTPMEVSAMHLAMGRKCMGGSFVGSIFETQEMLDFCGKHHIFCHVEKICISYIITALQRLQNSNVKYRFVIDCSSMRHPQEIFGYH